MIRYDTVRTMSEKPCILFTAFEPSGDELAAPVIRELRRMMPDVAIDALGGPCMKDAGARLIEQTTGHATMGAASIGKVREQLALRRRFKEWLRQHSVSVHVPTDSPAANWWFCKAVKRRCQGAMIVHFVAPQVWAWAPWRVNRLKKWSDRVLCVLPFEPRWFLKHDVKAIFVGHPMFESEVKFSSCEGKQNKLALLPGSRPGEIEANWPVMCEVFTQLRNRYPDLEGTIAASDEEVETRLRAMTVPWPSHLRVVTGQLHEVLSWADWVLSVSGTATLHVARHGKPMVILYKASAAQWHGIGRWLIQTRTFTLPNLIAGGGPGTDRSRHIVKEFVPFTGGVKNAGPIVEELVSLIEDKEKARRQMEALGEVVKPFESHNAGREAAEAIMSMYSQRV
jgi:lipid-A-disaccharide synthase